jgi:hypothetical protein
MAQRRARADGRRGWCAAPEIIDTIHRRRRRHAPMVAVSASLRL